MATDPNDTAFRVGLEQAKRASVAHSLLKAGRLVDELGIGRVRVQLGAPDLRRSHTRLFPHIDLTGTRPSVVASRAGISKQAVGVLLNELEAMDMVERVPDPQDGRAQLFRFVQRPGRSLLDGLSVLAGLDADLAQRLGRPRFARLREDLLALLSVLEELGPEAHGS